MVAGPLLLLLLAADALDVCARCLMVVAADAGAFKQRPKTMTSAASVAEQGMSVIT